MSIKRIFIIFLFSLTLVLGLNQSRSIQAEETPEPITYPFTPFYGEPLSISSNHWLPEVDDEVLVGYSLTVTEEMLSGMREAVAQGFTPAVDFQTRGIIEVVGDGFGNYSAQVIVAIDHAHGNRAVIWSEPSAAASDENRPSNIEKIERYTTPLDDWLDQMQAGDTLIVVGMAKGMARSGPESVDQVRVSWEVNGDPDRPIIVGITIPVGPDSTNNPD